MNKILVFIFSVFILTGCSASESVTTCTGDYNGFKVTNSFSAKGDNIFLINTSSSITLKYFREYFKSPNVSDEDIVTYLNERTNANVINQLGGIVVTVDAKPKNYSTFTTIDLNNADLEQLHSKNVLQFPYNEANLKALKLADTVNRSKEAGFECTTAEVVN